MASSVSAADLLAKKLYDLLVEEIKNNTSRGDWKGKGVVISFNQFSLTSKMKSDCNEQGTAFGCHTCPSHVEIDKDQPWVGDHFPPTELKDYARAALDKLFGTKLLVSTKKQILRPQCNDCSNQQAALVRKLNNMTASEIMKWLEKDEAELQWVLCLIQGVEPPNNGNCIMASGAKVSDSEGKAIQLLGVRDGCHSDPTHKYPVTKYHADHTWPQEFCTNYMDQVMEKLGLIKYKPKQQELRPQCPRCSGNQGGKLSQISKLALAFAEANNITFYK